MNNVNLILGKYYTKKDLSLLLSEPNIAISREGIYYCKKRVTDIIFADLEKQGKEERFHFNDFFDGDVFHWDSQPTQHLNTPKIIEINSGKVELLLFARIFQKIKGKTQPFVYCGRLEYLDFEEGTSKPVHQIFQSMDYDGDTTNSALQEIYQWKPQKAGKEVKTKITPEQILQAKKKRNLSKPNKTVQCRFQNSRVGQDWYRDELLKKWDSKCAVTGLSITNILISSHIKPWKDCNDEERLDEDNGILLAPNLDALFDKHLISFEDSGGIIINKNISQDDQKLLGINQELKLNLVTEGMKRYLEVHRIEFYRISYK